MDDPITRELTRMTREECIKMYKEIRSYLCTGNPMFEVEKVHEALTIAIINMKLVPKISSDLLDAISNAYENGYAQGKFEANSGNSTNQ